MDVYTPIKWGLFFLFCGLLFYLIARLGSFAVFLSYYQAKEYFMKKIKKEGK